MFLRQAKTSDAVVSISVVNVILVNIYNALFSLIINIRGSYVVFFLLLRDKNIDKIQFRAFADKGFPDQPVQSRRAVRDICAPVLLDVSLTVKAATLIFISGRGSAISSAKQGKSGSIYNLVKS